MRWLYLMVVLLEQLMIATDAQKSYHQVCLLVPQSTQDCLNRFEGRNQLSARISCLQVHFFRKQYNLVSERQGKQGQYETNKKNILND